MKRFRAVIFWVHLVAGLAGAIAIMVMSVTGALLAFQPQILATLERQVRQVDPPAGGNRMRLQAIMQAAMAAKPGVQPSGVTLESEPESSAQVAFGQGGGTLYINPYTGAVLGEGAIGARRVFRTLTDWHRWLALSGSSRATGRAITGISNLLFFGLAISGVYLWWPAAWTAARLRPITWFTAGARGKARDFNWHNVIGFWSAAVLIVLTWSGAVISYPWASNLMYRVTGSPLPPGRGEGPPQAARQGRGGEGRPGGDAAQGGEARQRGVGRDARQGAEARQGGEPRTGGEARQPEGGAPDRGREAGRERGERGEREANRPPHLPEGLDLAWARAEEMMPTWRSIAMRITPRPGDPINFTLTDAEHWNQFARSQLSVKAATGEVVRWEPYAANNAGQKLRGWLRFAHTGELGGIIGQTVAGIACVGGAFLVWTGVALALRRLTARRMRRTQVTARAA
jgi:uncharacterized iron-regulated membrane protein